VGNRKGVTASIPSRGGRRNEPGHKKGKYKGEEILVRSPVRGFGERGRGGKKGSVGRSKGGEGGMFFCAGNRCPPLLPVTRER